MRTLVVVIPALVAEALTFVVTEFFITRFFIVVPAYILFDVLNLPEGIELEFFIFLLLSLAVGIARSNGFVL